MSKSYWTIWTKTSTEQKVAKVLEQVLALMHKEAQEIAIEPDAEIPGHKVCFTLELMSESWNDHIVEVIHLGQRVAYQWQLSGDVLEDPQGWSIKAKESGVVAMQLRLS